MLVSNSSDTLTEMIVAMRQDLISLKTTQKSRADSYKYHKQTYTIGQYIDDMGNSIKLWHFELIPYKQDKNNIIMGVYPCVEGVQYYASPILTPRNQFDINYYQTSVWSGAPSREKMYAGKEVNFFGNCDFYVKATSSIIS